VKSKEPDLLEGKVKDAVRSVLKQWGAYQYWPVKATPIGAKTVDCLACIPVKITKDMVGKTLGAFVAIETKRTKIGKPTGAQGEVLKQVKATGGGAALIHTTSDIDIEAGLVLAIWEGESETWVTIGGGKKAMGV
jgi:hypothetical protein